VQCKEATCWIVKGQSFKGETLAANKEQCQKVISPSGNRTRVSRVTGGDTDPYTNEDWLMQ
jgi:hypothetical protein